METKLKQSNNPGEYYRRSEVSNSDLTELKNLLYPRVQYGDKEAAFRFGSLVDAIITEQKRVNYYRYTVDNEQYTEEEFNHAKEMHRALRMEASRDTFLAKVLEFADTQNFMVNHGQQFEYGEFSFTLDTRCKWDWWLPQFKFGGDLKTTFAESQAQFDEAVYFFDWDRSRAWYMDIAGSNRDFIYAISKKNCKIFKKYINRGDAIYNRGREKYEELAFQYWCLKLVI
ncbi:PD-(D/E)XK nuclease-like domain-containing protein [Barnesiella propionica]|uniref:PD-(D/E)XK nuclease-like domain-containing protein n=1 Tax=Barnesiella propionica TaxID=2981781 RepID=UPI0011C7B201|nr:PD-(D/E)XK nuclease-like domain-containing protein [Barnesiella propionica]MCU6767385.1 PD-(D/E)XK nuclease-like domain-containing protein [Barnesiella propionica]